MSKLGMLVCMTSSSAFAIKQSADSMGCQLSEAVRLKE